MARSGYDPTRPRLRGFRRIWTSAQFDGEVYAEPLVAGGRVVVATENDSVYAVDASSGRVLWRTHLGDPVPLARLPCGNIDPTGITGTPVIDGGVGVVYAVAFVEPGRHELVALDVGTGEVRFRRSVDPPGADPLVEQQRAALALSRDTVYVAYGGLFGDCGAYHGWVVSVRSDGKGPLLDFRVPTGRAGGSGRHRDRP